MPALIITKEQIDEELNILEKTLKKTIKKIKL
jgi:adenosylmethionine-8-amino-7-oxononanoate aminotransferase